MQDKNENENAPNAFQCAIFFVRITAKEKSCSCYFEQKLNEIFRDSFVRVFTEKFEQKLP